MRAGIIGGLVVGFLLAGPAAATQYQITFSATVTGYRSVDRDFNEVNLPVDISIGDTFSASVIFDPSAYAVQPLYDDDPTINIYWGSVFGGDYRVGDYSYSTPAETTDFSSLQLWNNYYVSDRLPSVDSFSLSVVSNTNGSMVPVDLGDGTINLAMHLNLFDFTAIARESDLISEVTSFDLFGSQNASFGFINSETYLQTSFTTTSVQASIMALPAVPEPASWALMIAGFGVVGRVLRRRGASTRCGYC